MMEIRICYLTIGIFKIILTVSASTHWVVTENGRLQSLSESMFQMQRPYDLMSLLEQENRRDSVNKLLESLKNRKAIIDNQFVGLHTASDVENGLHMNDADCLLRDQYDFGWNFYHSIATDGNLRHGMMQNNFHRVDIPSKSEKKVPDCKNTFQQDFSMHTFEHLNAMQDREYLTQLQETALLKIIPPNMELDLFGHKIAHELLYNKTSWVHLNLASIYWRIKGNAYNALECSRRAIVKAPRQYRDIALLTTGGIFHAANKSREAAIILHTAIEYEPTESLHHLALANVYAQLGEFNKSVQFYDNSLRLDPQLDMARSAKHNILCNLKLESSLSALHRQLTNILSELRAYHNEETELLSFQEKILWEDIKQIPFLTHQGGSFEDHLSSISMNLGQSCMQKSGDKSILSCDIISEKQILAQKLQIDFGVSLQVLKNVENQAKEIREKMMNSKINSALQPSKSENHVGQTRDYSRFSSVFMEPTDRPKYHNFKIQKSTELFEDPDWPIYSYCETLIPFALDVRQYIPVYLPPENKGYVTYLFVSELIGIEPEKEHPLPWSPPKCQSPRSFDRKYIPSELVKATTGYNLPDSNLMPSLTSLVEGAEISEIGQRILTATSSKVAAPWVLSMLASLYWRIVGKPRNALDCLQLAITSVPDRFRDVPLISIASISQKFSLIDNALFVAQEAFRVNPVEPITNYLYGTLLHIKGNSSGAMHHLKQSLRVDPRLMDGRAMTMLETIACQERFNAAYLNEYEDIS
ncbi:hypothetical protein QAD02_014313 [Eretmocerus hayati]|uniref:Uncharacterized protein n=1 Tax=Eretmocerus hayati TaxID=131215 RepID=A0ACC2P674_9HYME|nr:hypothetical protein QAD02_014313 [Eretmocerus hayati]